MKFRGNNQKSHLLIYCVLFMAILILIGPLYAISHNTLKDQVLKDSQAAVSRGMSRLDMEIEVLQNIRLEMQNTSEFIRMKNLSSFEEVRQYIIFKDFADYFKTQTKTFVLASNSYVFFRNNSCVVSDKYQYDNMEPIFNEHIRMEDMDWKQFRASLFENEEEFSARYVEDLYVDGEYQPSLVVSLSLSPSISQSEAMLVWIYSIDDLFEDMNLSDYQEVFDYISFNDKAIFTKNNKPNQEHQIVEGCKNISLKVAMDISEQYFDRQMNTFRTFLIVYFIVLIIFIICLEWFLNYWKNKPVRQMVKLMENLTGDKSTDDKGIEYVSDIMKQINLENKQYYKDMLNFMFFKRLDENECEFIRSKYPDFTNPFFFAAFFGERINIRILNLCMEKYGVKSQRILSPHEGECIVFFKYSKEIDIDALRETLAEVVDMLKEYDVHTSTLISIPCNDVSEFYDAYQYIKSNYRFVDYSGVFSFKNGESNNSVKNDRKHLYDSLYNNLIQGNAFEANQAVYKLWYQVMTNGYNSVDPIRKMFYRQLGILEDAAEKVNYRGELTRYDGKKKINDLAFSIAGDIENICSLISLRETQENGRIQEIISWMNEHFKEPDFCMTSMENQFGMSGKTIGKIIKSTTGKTFQEYVEECRIELAKQLISEPVVNMKAVAQECGFVNYDTFYKFFKKHTGVSPKQWKNNTDITM